MSKGTATSIVICGKNIKLGDFVKVQYESGGTIQGKVVELWCYDLDNHLQSRVESGWCFHDHDTILEHKEGAADTNESDAIALIFSLHQAVSTGLAPGIWYHSNRALVEKIAQQARVS